jgi:hypothetical protein
MYPFHTWIDEVPLFLALGGEELEDSSFKCEAGVSGLKAGCPYPAKEKVEDQSFEFEARRVGARGLQSTRL